MMKRVISGMLGSICAVGLTAGIVETSTDIDIGTALEAITSYYQLEKDLIDNMDDIDKLVESLENFEETEFYKEYVNGEDYNE